jgi:rubrerythrin
MNVFNQETQLLSFYGQLQKEAARMELYALKATQENKPELQRYFQALFHSFSAQAKRILLQVRGTTQQTSANLEQLLAQELPEISSQCKELFQKAQEQQIKALQTGFDHCTRIAHISHQAGRKLQEGKQYAGYYICDFCGFIATENRPSQCPVCTAASHRFIEVAE